MRRLAPCLLTIVTATTMAAVEVTAPIPGRLHLDTTLFADDTEFANDRRDGDTLLGAQGRLYARLDLGPAAQLRLGVFAWGRTGTDDGVEDVMPVVALHLISEQQRFILGTIEQQRADRLPGPDRDAPHGLLPALREERLAFTDAYESGAQWLVSTPRCNSDLWLDWQQVNTPDHREAFTVGTVGDCRLAGPLHVTWQGDIWHQGGQQYGANEPVADSMAGGPGLRLAFGDPGQRWVAADAYRLYAIDRPNREQSDLNASGQAWFARLEGGLHQLRAHAILWWGDGFEHHSGDANYQSQLADGTNRDGFHRYAEAGVSGIWRPAPGLRLEPALRGHVVQDGEVELSVRLVGTVSTDVLLWR